MSRSKPTHKKKNTTEMTSRKINLVMRMNSFVLVVVMKVLLIFREGEDSVSEH